MPQPSNASRLGLSVTIAAVFAAAGQPRALGTVVSWANAAGGSAATGANWTPTGVPAAADDLTFSLAGTYPVSFNASVLTSRTQTYSAGTVLLTMLNPHTVTSGITVGDVAASNTTMTLTTGTMTSGGPVTLGNAAGSAGRINVHDNDADLLLNGATGNLTLGRAGTGTLVVANGGLVDVSGRLVAGSGSSSVGALTVTGFSTTPAVTSTCLVRGLTTPSAIGLSGDATADILGGGAMHVFGTLNVAQNSTSTATLTVGNGGTDFSVLQVDGDLHVASNQSAGVAAGVGTMTLVGPSDVTVGGALHVGNDPDGGTGTLNIASGATLTTGSLTINDTNGTLNHTGGAIIVRGGILDPRGQTLTVDGPGAPDVHLFNGAQAILSAVSPIPALRVAAAQRGVLTVEGTGSLLTVSGDAQMGSGTTGLGEMRTRLGGQISISGLLSVGLGGAGLLTVYEAARLDVGTLYISRSPNVGLSLAVIEDAGTVLSASGPVAVGGDTAAGGPGILRIRDLAHANLLSDLTIWPDGSLEVLFATLDVAGGVEARGDVTLTSGTINVPVASDFRLAGTLTGSGTINGRVRLTQTAAIIAPTGPMTLGTVNSANGFDNSGLLQVGTATVQLLDATAAFIGNTTITGGHLGCNNSLFLAATKTLSGAGFIDAPLTNSGTIFSQGAGLTFTRPVTGIGLGISGATTHWLNGGGFSGTGTIASIIDADGAAVFTASGGPLTLGNSASQFGYSNAGTLHCGPNTVTLLNSNGVGLGLLTDLDGGALICSQQLSVNVGGRLAGRGNISTPALHFNSGAILSPGDIPASATGQFTVSGAVTFAGTSTFECQIGGTAIGQFDRIANGSTASLSGSLAVSLANNFVPAPGDQFQILSAILGRTGTFLNTSLPFGFSVRYASNTVTLVYCPADFDHDGALAVADIFTFLNAWFAGNPAANFNQTGATDVQDIFDFLSAWFAGC